MGALAPHPHVLKTGETAILRSAFPDDAAAVLAHGRAVVGESKFVLMHPDEFTLTEEQEREWIRQYADDPGKLLLVAEVFGEIPGVLFFEPGTRLRLAHRGTLHMSVRREWRGRGLGTALLVSLIAWAEAHPAIEKLSLEVFATNVIALALYQKLGFVEAGRLPREIKYGPGEYVDLLLMHRFV